MSNNNELFEDLLKEIIQQKPINDEGKPTTEEDIAILIGRNKGYIAQVRSRYKKGEDVPDKIINLLQLQLVYADGQHRLRTVKDIVQAPHHGQKFEKPEITINNLVESNKSLAASHKQAMENQGKMLDANAVIAKSNADMAATILALTNSGGGLSNQLNYSAQLMQDVARMARNGTKVPGLWKTEEEGEKILDKLLSFSEEEMQQESKRAVADKPHI